MRLRSAAVLHRSLQGLSVARRFPRAAKRRLRPTAEEVNGSLALALVLVCSRARAVFAGIVAGGALSFWWWRLGMHLLRPGETTTSLAFTLISFAENLFWDAVASMPSGGKIVFAVSLGILVLCLVGIMMWLVTITAMLVFKAWAAVQDEHAALSPG